MNPLDNFGELYIQQVRDNSLFMLEAVLNGKMKDAQSQLLHAELAQLSPQHLELMRRFATYLVDNTLHNCLDLFEENPEWKITDNDGQSLAELSDGLCGELYTQDGWIERFSAYGVKSSKDNK